MEEKEKKKTKRNFYMCTYECCTFLDWTFDVQQNIVEWIEKYLISSIIYI